MSYKLLFTLLIYWGGTCFCLAQKAVIIRDFSKVQKLNTQVEYLQDHTAKLGLKDILTPQLQQKFRPNTQPVLNLGTTETSVWVKFKIRVQSTEKTAYFLEEKNAMIDFVTLYQELSNGAYHSIKTGDHFDYATRLIKNNNFLFKLSLEPGQTYTFYLHCKGKGVFHIDLRLASGQAMLEIKHQEDLFMGIYIGILLLNIMYNFCIYLYTLEKSYIYYVIYVFTIVLASTYGKGLALEFLWPNKPWLNDYSPSLIAVNFLATILFTNRFLYTKKYAPKWRKFSFVIMFIFALVLVLNHTHYVLSLHILQVLGSLAAFLAVILGLVVLRNGYPLARFYLFAWSLLSCFFIITAFKNIGWLPVRGMIVNYSLEIGSALEALLLSLALADKLSYYRKTKQKTTQQLLEAVEHNRQILEGQNKLLEQKVKERTTEVILQNQQLEQQKREITQQKEEIIQQAEELKATNNQLTSLSEFKQQMTGMIVHDLKNPLNSIIGLSNGKKAQNLPFIHQSGQQMLHMVMNILDVQKFEEAEVPLAIESHHLSDLIQDVLSQVQLLIDEKSIHLTLDLLPDLFFKADYDLISRVLVNLLSNAIKYTPSSGKLLVNVSQNIAKDGFYKISICDEGPGIAPNQVAHIFNKYGQFKAHRSGGVRSTGLGLTFCKLVVEAHRGTIGVDSVLGQGSTFWFTVPIGEAVVARVKEAPLAKVEAQIVDHFDFSEEEIQLLKKALPKVRHYEIYELSAVKDFLDQQPWEGFPTLLHWRQALENAMFDWNEERFRELMSIEC